MEFQSEIKMKFTIGVMKKSYSKNFYKISCKKSMMENGILSDFRFVKNDAVTIASRKI